MDKEILLFFSFLPYLSFMTVCHFFNALFCDLVLEDTS